MANPITPNGFTRGRSITDEAAIQDAERQARAAQDHYDQTGNRLPPFRNNDPLVPINGYTPPAIANDGDSYSNLGGNNNSFAAGTAMPNNLPQAPRGGTGESGYIEDNPTRRIERRDVRNSPQFQEILERERMEMGDQKSKKEIEEEENCKKSIEEARKKYNNALSGLEIDDDEE